ncbi:uncharacterized protein LOC101852743 [Aplysia californica]|uniref:Uncharacterized protein LOC101852743 n=1 Tax=Aplysia californica TaxID=6500 RepID=A0ABM1ADM9_APLCA|nr:uncharacterized protein LOC101852743 [Aplysia californica]
MLRITALNDTANTQDDPRNIQLSKTKEAKEAEAFAVYNKALLHQQKGNSVYTEKLLRNLFDHPLLREAASLVEDEAQTPNHRGLQLLYSIHKNLASILLQRDDYHEAMASYIQAVRIDSSEVTVWYKMGHVARKLHNYPLAKICFQQGLVCNPNHWPCLDNVITVTFALGDYLMCLEHISTALEKDAGYPKGLVFRKQIIKEHPSLESLTKELFLHCDPFMDSSPVDEEEAAELLEEARKIRTKCRQLASEDREKEAQPVTFAKSLTPFTWTNVGEQLISLYDFATSSQPPKSLGLEVDMRDYFFLDQSVLGSGLSTNNADSNRKPIGSRRVSFEAATPTEGTGSAFQRAKQRGAVVKVTPKSLNISDFMKESALLERLQGRAPSGGSGSGSGSGGEERRKSSAEPREGREQRPPREGREQRPQEEVGKRAGQTGGAAEDDDEGMEVDPPVLSLLQGEGEMDISLEDIQKIPLAPDLLLKADEECLALADVTPLELADAKSLDHVLASVIDMEFAQAAGEDKDKQGPSSAMVEDAAKSGEPRQTSAELGGDPGVVRREEGEEEGGCAVVATVGSDGAGATEGVAPSRAVLLSPRSHGSLGHAHLSPSHAQSSPGHAQVSPPSHTHLSPSHTHLSPSHAQVSPGHAHLSPPVGTNTPSHTRPASSPKGHTALGQSHMSPGHDLQDLRGQPEMSLNPPRAAAHLPPGFSSPSKSSTHGENNAGIPPSPAPPGSTPHPSSSSSPRQTISTLSLTAVQQLNSAPLSVSLDKYSTQLQPPEAVHSPIATFLLSPNSSSTTVPRWSPYLSVLDTPLLGHATREGGAVKSESSKLAQQDLISPSHDSQTLMKSPSQALKSPPQAMKSPSQDSQALKNYSQALSPSRDSQQVLKSPSQDSQVLKSPSKTSQALKSLSHSGEKGVGAEKMLSSTAAERVRRGDLIEDIVRSHLASDAGQGPSVSPLDVHRSKVVNLGLKSQSSAVALSGVVGASVGSKPPTGLLATTASQLTPQGGTTAPHHLRLGHSSASSGNFPTRHQHDRLTSIDVPLVAHEVSSCPLSPRQQQQQQQSAVSLLPRRHAHSDPVLPQEKSGERSEFVSVAPRLSRTQSALSALHVESLLGLPSPATSLSSQPGRRSEWGTEGLLTTAAAAAHQRESGHIKSRSLLSRSTSVPGYYSQHKLSSTDLSHHPSVLSPPHHNPPSSWWSSFFPASSSSSPSLTPSLNQQPLSSLPGSSLLRGQPSSFPPYPVRGSHHNNPDVRNATPTPSSPLLSSLPPAPPSSTTTTPLWQPYSTRPPLSSGQSKSGKVSTSYQTTSSSLSPPTQLAGLVQRSPHGSPSKILSPTGTSPEHQRALSHSPISSQGRQAKGLSLLSHLSPSEGHTGGHAQGRDGGSVDSRVGSTTQSRASGLSPHKTPVAASQVHSDHSYHQKREQLFQSMVETMLTSSSGGPATSDPTQQRPTSAQVLAQNVTPLTSLDSAARSLTQQTSPNSAAGRARSNRGISSAGAGTSSSSRRGAKRKVEVAALSSWSEEWSSVSKRRSTRSRTGRGKKEKKEMDYQGLMRKYLPSSLLKSYHGDHVSLHEDTPMETPDSAAAPETTKKEDGQGQGCLPASESLKAKEEEDVRNFVRECLKGHGILQMVYKFLLRLSLKWRLCWYEGVVRVYLELYARLRSHWTVPCVHVSPQGFSADGLRDNASVVLVWYELYLDKLMGERGGSKSNLLSPPPPSLKTTTAGEAGDATDASCLPSARQREEDLLFLAAMRNREDALGDKFGEFFVRVYWLKAKQHQLLNETLDAVDCYEITTELLQEQQQQQSQKESSDIPPSAEKVSVTLPNVKFSGVISEREVSKQLDSLQRCKNLEETQRLHELGRHEEVVNNLMSTFSKQGVSSPRVTSLPERPSQLLLLQDSLHSLDRQNECVFSGVISEREVSKQLDSLQRCKNLEETQRLHELGRHEEVVNNLMSTFSKQGVSSPRVTSLPERPSQLRLLQDSLHSLGRQDECVVWAEVSLHEALQHYKRVPTPQLRQDWADTLVSLFASLDRVLSEDGDLLKALSEKCTVRLVENILSVIEIILDVADSVTEMPISSVLPWKILYRVIKFEETRASCEKTESARRESCEQDSEELSPSLLMLIDAHQYLGKHGWCTHENGELLLFTMSVLYEKLKGREEEEEEEEEDKEALSTAFEQCVFCLYGHPNKRGKAKHLSEHNSSPVPLTWARAGPVFQHFVPAQVPEFDSYKTSTVSSELENLLKRMYVLVPARLNPADHLSHVTDYIEGVVPGSAPSRSSVEPECRQREDPYNICGLLFYLLGDFYFKNKEPAKAVKFYQLDVVLNCSRLDSWAGLALAKMSQIEQKLSSTELKLDAPINKKSESALRCFRRAVELESGSHKLWLEYGSLAYQLHSHASRQLKLRDMFPVSGEQVLNAQVRRSEMLSLAQSSYRQAGRCEGESTEDDWLTHYMLGKMAEKRRDRPYVYLECYRQAAICLHQEEAVYPRKILFASYPPHLALESVEVFYRVHASVSKLLLSEGAAGEALTAEEMTVLERYVEGALSGHFARGEEKRRQVCKEDRESSTTTSTKPPTTASSTSGITTTTTSTTTRAVRLDKPVYHKTTPDHDYSRHKSTSDSQSSDQTDDTISRTPAGPPPQESSTLAGTSTAPAGLVPSEQQIKSEEEEVVKEGERKPMVQLLFESEVKPLIPGVAAHGEGMDGVEEKMDGVKEDVEELKEDVNKGKEKMDGEKDKMDVDVADNFDGGKENVDEVKENVAGESEKTDGEKEKMDVEDRSRLGSQTESSEDEAGWTSCGGNEADLESDAMEVVGEEKVGWSQGGERDPLSVVSSPSSQDSVGHLAGRSQAARGIGTTAAEGAVVDVMEVHAEEKSEPRTDRLMGVRTEKAVDTQTDTRTDTQTDSQTDPGTPTAVWSDRSVLESDGFSPHTDCENVMEVDNAPPHTDTRPDTHTDARPDTKTDTQTDTRTHTTTNPPSYTSTSGLPRREEVSTAATEEGVVEGKTTEENRLKSAADVQIGDAGLEKVEAGCHVEKWEVEDREKPVLGGGEREVRGEREAREERVEGKKRVEGEKREAEETSGPSGPEAGRGDASFQPASDPLRQRENRSPEPSSTMEHSGAPAVSDVQLSPAVRRRRLMDRCIEGIQLCAARFSSHYKSLYRLAYIYSHSADHKNLQFARDLLLGCPDWQEQKHMPASGLFYERKLNNFFQGLWKIPIDDIDRSGCFASHVLRSVRLLMEVLAQLGDIDTLKHLRQQLRRTPDAGKKYLRDAERLILAEEAFLQCLSILQGGMDRSDQWSEGEREENLARVYRVWLSGKGGKHGPEATAALHRAFRTMMKGRTDVNRLTAEQAILYCQQNLAKAATAPSSSFPSQSAAKVTNQASTDKPRTNHFPSVQSSTTQSEKPARTEPIRSAESSQMETDSVETTTLTQQVERQSNEAWNLTGSRSVSGGEELSAVCGVSGAESMDVSQFGAPSSGGQQQPARPPPTTDTTPTTSSDISCNNFSSKNPTTISTTNTYSSNFNISNAATTNINISNTTTTTINPCSISTTFDNSTTTSNTNPTFINTNINTATVATTINTTTAATTTTINTASAATTSNTTTPATTNTITSNTTTAASTINTTTAATTSNMAATINTTAAATTINTTAAATTINTTAAATTINTIAMAASTSNTTPLSQKTEIPSVCGSTWSVVHTDKLSCVGSRRETDAEAASSLGRKVGEAAGDPVSGVAVVSDTTVSGPRVVGDGLVSDGSEGDDGGDPCRGQEENLSPAREDGVIVISDIE